MNVALYKTSKKYDIRDYFYMWLKSPYMAKFIEEMLSGSIQKFIGLGDFRDMYLIEPNEITAEYCNSLKESFTKIIILKDENRRLSGFLKMLSPLLLTGSVKMK